jgi:hypothetical protein
MWHTERHGNGSSEQHCFEKRAMHKNLGQENISEP